MREDGLTQDEVEKVLAWAGRHTEILREQLSEASDRAQRYLVLTNGGSAVALLAFMGAAPDFRDAATAWISLAFYFFGIVLCGVLAAASYEHRNQTFRRWVQDVNDFERGRGGIETAVQDLNDAVVRLGRTLELVGYASFGCFIVGSGVVGVGRLVSWVL